MPYTTYPAIRIYTSCIIVLFLGLLWALEPDRIFIISKYIDNGNLHLYIHNKSKPFSWCLHLFFATDIAHALAYLHTRKCIYCNLKGENLLVTSNGDVLELKQLTFCGTDSYMSPEVLLGDEEDEIQKLASLGCPPDMIALCLDCLATDPAIEDEDAHIGSIKFMTGGKRPSAGLKDIQSSGSSTDDSDDELMEAVMGLSSLGVNSGWSDSTGGKPVPHLDHDGNQPLLNTGSSEYSTMVIHLHPSQQTVPPSLSSILTIPASPNPNKTPDQVLPASNPSPSSCSTIVAQCAEGKDLLGTSSIMSIDSLDLYHTVAGVSAISSTLVTEGGSMIRSLHGNYPKKNSISGAISPPGKAVTWNLLDLIFSSGLFVAEYDVCTKWLGWKPVLECDDCGLKAHIKCGEVALCDCGLQPSFYDHTTGMSLVSKVKQGGKGSLTR
ncbi:kinase-like domain-containing protein [Armillaria mellea]|nr:kinase-like domain-containing protein [Armillaria mellea]